MIHPEGDPGDWGVVRAVLAGLGPIMGPRNLPLHSAALPNPRFCGGRPWALGDWPAKLGAAAREGSKSKSQARLIAAECWPTVTTESRARLEAGRTS